MKIAVIGSGIAGLSATWALKDQHQVTLYERWPKIGMDAHTVELGSGANAVAINVPMRVFFPEYYPTLTQLYKELNIAFEPVQYSGSFSEFGGKTLFRYRNYWLGRHTVPFLAGRSLRNPKAMKIGIELLRLLNQSGDKSEDATLDNVSLETYLRQKGYSRLFAEQFLYPTFAGICTCSFDAVKAYPASIILGYLRSGLAWSKVYRLTHGTQDAAKRLAASAHKTFFGISLNAVTTKQNGVEVTDGHGHRETYDHVIMATQANQALTLLPNASDREKAVLQRFCYEKSRIIVHSDERLAPDNQQEWAPVNFLLSKNHNKPMASIWLNSIHPQLAKQPNFFETWNPLQEPAPESVLLEANFERPIVTTDSLQAITQLEQLHSEANRRIWFCGSYSKRGIPLLESAATSAFDIASRLNSAEIKAYPP